MSENLVPSNNKPIDYLTEDQPVQGQSWVCLSFLSPEGISNCKIRGLKVRGVFATAEEAHSHAKHLHTIDPDFDVFVGEVGKWLPWNPDPTEVQEEVFAEKELNDLMKKYKENREQTKLEEEQRKQELLKSVKKKEQSEQNESADKKLKIRERLQQKLNEKKAQQQQQQQQPPSESIPTSNHVDESEQEPDQQSGQEQLEQVAENEQPSLEQINEELNDKLKEVRSLDTNLKKIKSLYEKVQNKKK